MKGHNIDMRSKNIDSLIEMLMDVQKENGINPTMEEAIFDPDTKERFNIFKKQKLKKQGVDLSKYGKNYRKGSCNGCKDNKPVSNIERGVFIYSEEDLIDDGDGEYVCEYCTKIGYNSSYKPSVCDTCDECESCSEYSNGTCDGCQYSLVFNGGRSYSEVTNQEYDINDEDAEIIEDITDDEPHYDTFKPDRKFTILDF